MSGQAGELPLRDGDPPPNGTGGPLGGLVNPRPVPRRVPASYLAPTRTPPYLAHLRPPVADWVIAAARADDAINPPILVVLFRCGDTGAGCCQIAAALATHRRRVHARCTGNPAAGVSRPVLAVLRELGVNPAAARPAALTDLMLRTAAAVVTIGSIDTPPPTRRGTRHLHWPVTDPDRATLRAVRAVRDDLDTRVRALLADLTNDHR